MNQPRSSVSVKTEVLAGITTFISMMYILVVNPAILSAGGMPKEAVFTATVLASAVMTIVMGVFTGLPIALAPGMGLNAFFAYTLCLGNKIPWQASLGIVFYSGILFMLLTVSGLRKKILSWIPASVRHGLTVGIGLFITLIGLKNAGIIVAHPVTLLTLGRLQDPEVFIIVIGILVSAFLMMKKVTGSLLWTMALIAVAFAVIGKVALPQTIVSLPPSLKPTLLQLDLRYFWQNPGVCLPLVLSLLFVDLFDNMGTLIAVCTRAGLQDENGEIRNLNKALRADALAAMLGATLGTSSVTSYIESAAGVEQGGRTGLTSIVTGICFLLALFISPLLLAIPLSATTPALVMVGFFMMSEVTKIDFKSIPEALPAFITMIMIPFSFSIAEGLAFGIATYGALKVAGKVGLLPFGWRVGRSENPA